MRLKQYIKDWYLAKSSRANFALIRNISKNGTYISELQNYIEFSCDNIEQLLYHYINASKDLPKCKSCSNDLVFKGLSTGYLTYCSKSCKTSHSHKTGNFNESYLKRSDTFKERHGVGSDGYDAISEKRRNTSIQRYGVHHPMQNKEVSERYKQASLKKYGESNPMKLKAVQDKVNNTNIQKYGYNRPLKNADVFERMYINYKKTIRERYGIDCVFQIPEVFEKAQLSSFKRNYYKHLHYQATYEHDFLLKVESLGMIDKLSNGPYLWYFHSGKSKRYFSDFYIEDINLVIEIKSTYWYIMYKDQNDAKRDECLAQGFKYILILDKDYTEFNTYIEEIN